MRRQFPLLREQERPLHYLDNAATAQMHESVFAAMAAHDRSARGNVLRGNHRLGEAATLAYEAARRGVAAFLNAAGAAEVVFTSGATAGINLVAAALARRLRAGDEILVSLAEHHSNLLPWQRLGDMGVRLKVLPLRADGRIRVDAAGELIGPRCRMVAVTHASNVTGAVTDVREVIAAARRAGAWVLLDGAQAVQHGPVDVQALGADFYAFSGHKCFGPTGIGVLWGRGEALAALPPFMTGGGMVGRVRIEASTWADPPRRFEAGTPPIAQAVGLAAACDWMRTLDWAAVREHEDRLLRRLLAELPRIPGLRLLGPTQIGQRLPVVSFMLGDLHPHDICQVLDGLDVALRGGHHCAQPLMDFFGVAGATRASLALYNDDADIDALLTGLGQAARILR
jgi:cysteine desulfurase/selenocysteine lyase